MKYIMIRTDDMLNGQGLRVVLFVSKCSHRCFGCHNPESWKCDSGELFDGTAKLEIFHELEKDYISGLTLSGGDPLHEDNRKDILSLVQEVKCLFPNKNIWLYTGYEYKEILAHSDMVEILQYCDVLVDGKFEQDKADVKYKWAGSTNQRVINVQESLKQNKVVLYED